MRVSLSLLQNAALLVRFQGRRLSWLRNVAVALPAAVRASVLDRANGDWPNPPLTETHTLTNVDSSGIDIKITLSGNLE